MMGVHKIHMYVTKSFPHNNSHCDIVQHAMIAPLNTMWMRDHCVACKMNHTPCGRYAHDDEIDRIKVHTELSNLH